MSISVWERILNIGMVVLMFSLGLFLTAAVRVIILKGDLLKPLQYAIISTFTLAAVCLVIGTLGMI